MRTRTDYGPCDQNFLYLAGILFQDITTLLLDTKAFRDTIDLFVERYKDKNISVVAGKLSILYQTYCFFFFFFVEHLYLWLGV